MYFMPSLYYLDVYGVASLPDDARVVIYDHHVFIVQATGSNCIVLNALPNQPGSNLALLSREGNNFVDRQNVRLT